MKSDIKRDLTRPGYMGNVGGHTGPKLKRSKRVEAPFVTVYWEFYSSKLPSIMPKYDEDTPSISCGHRFTHKYEEKPTQYRYISYFEVYKCSRFPLGACLLVLIFWP